MEHSERKRIEELFDNYEQDDNFGDWWQSASEEERELYEDQYDIIEETRVLQGSDGVARLLKLWRHQGVETVGPIGGQYDES